MIFNIFYVKGGEKLINKAIVAGRLVKAPLLRQAANNTMIVTFSLAVDRGNSKQGERQTDFLMCKAFNKTAENIHKYCNQGSFVSITGQIHSTRYEKDGKTNFGTEILIENIKFLPNMSSNKAEKHESRADTIWNSLSEEVKDKITNSLLTKGTDQLLQTQSTAEERWNSKLFENQEDKSPNVFAEQADEIIKKATNNEVNIENKDETSSQESDGETSAESEDSTVTDSNIPF